MGMGELMDRSYMALPPAAKTQEQQVNEALSWFTREFRRRHPEYANGGTHEALARLWFVEGMDYMSKLSAELVERVERGIEQALAVQQHQEDNEY